MNNSISYRSKTLSSAKKMTKKMEAGKSTVKSNKYTVDIYSQCMFGASQNKSCLN